MVYKLDIFRKVGGVVMCLFEATQGEHLGLFGGHEETMIDSGHWASMFARSSDGAMTVDICLGRGFKTAMPPLKVFCHTVCKCCTMRSAKAELPLAGSSASVFARAEYFELIVALS